jgi:hypothetical protein
MFVNFRFLQVQNGFERILFDAIKQIKEAWN